MADHAPPGSGPVGSVAEETARLLDALLAAVPGPAVDPPTAPVCPSCGGREADDRTEAPPPPPPPSTCRLCPVCQLLQVAQAVRPDLVDRLADLAGAVTELLRDVAVARRAEHSPGPADGPRPESGHASPSVDVEDIVVGTGDDLDDLDDVDFDLDDSEHDPHDSRDPHDPRPEESRP